MDDRRAFRWEHGLLGLLVGLAGMSALLLAGQVIAPGRLLMAGFVVDRLSASLGLLVALVGAVTFRFSLHYLNGEPGRQLFLFRLALTVGAAYVLMFADHLLILLMSWTLTSLGLHTLLTHYPDRFEAIRPARKKFLISRLGDVALLAMIVMIGVNWGTLSVSGFLAAAGREGGDRQVALQAVVILVAVAALTKSAQFPFHSWLPETMEAPTPVSALMHAGIINAGGVLLLRFSPVVVQVPAALLLLSAVGTLTASLGLLAMWSQVKVKRTLAWSTVGQMGFMMIQCGLAAFPAAWLHILGHGLYKAWSFLRSGDLPKPSQPTVPISPARRLGMAASGTLLAIPSLALASQVTGFSPQDSPGEVALSAIVALSIGQLWVVLLGSPAIVRSTVRRIVGAIGASLGTAFGALALYRGAGMFLIPVFGEMHAPQGPLAWGAAVLPVAAMVSLTVIQAILPVIGRRAIGRALYVHALNGFYFGAFADRFVERIWALPAQAKKGVEGV